MKPHQKRLIDAAKLEEKLLDMLDPLHKTKERMERIKNKVIDEAVNAPIQMGSKKIAQSFFGHGFLVGKAGAGLGKAMAEIARPVRALKAALHEATAFRYGPTAMDSIYQAYGEDARAAAIEAAATKIHVQQALESPFLPPLQIEPFPLLSFSMDESPKDTIFSSPDWMHLHEKITFEAITPEIPTERAKEIVANNMHALGLSQAAADDACRCCPDIITLNHHLIGLREAQAQFFNAAESRTELERFEQGISGFKRFADTLNSPAFKTLTNIFQFGLETMRTIQAFDAIPFSHFKALATFSAIGMGLGAVSIMLGFFQGPDPMIARLNRMDEKLDALLEGQESLRMEIQYLREDQQRMLTFTREEIGDLKAALLNETKTLRIEMTEAFHKIELSLNYVIDYARTLARTQCLNHLKRHCEETKTIILSQGRRARELTRSLELDLQLEVRNDILTGHAEYLSNPPPDEQLRILKIPFLPNSTIDDTRLNFLLGFLLQRPMVNPLLLHLVSDHLIQHFKRFFILYIEESDVLLTDQIKMIAEEELVFAQLDDQITEALSTYHRALNSVKDSGKACIDAFNIIRKNAYLADYRKDRLADNPTIADFDVVKPPEYLIDQFKENRGIAGHFKNLEINALFRPYAETYGPADYDNECNDSERTSTLRLSRLFHDTKHAEMNKTDRALILCAEFLNEIRLIPHVEPLHYPKIPFERIVGEEAFGKDASPSMKDIKHIANHRSGEGFQFLGNRDELWALTLQLRQEGTDESRIILKYSENYHSLKKQIDGVSSMYEPTCGSNENAHDRSAFYFAPGGAKDFHRKLRTSIAKHIETRWNSGHASCCQVTLNKQGLHEAISNRLKAERETLIDTLCTQSGVVDASLLATFKNNLLHLDIATHRMKLLLHLAGKKWPSGQPLLDSQSILQDIRNQKDHVTSCELMPHLTSACLGSPIETSDLEPMNDRGSFHPKKLFHSASRAFHGYQLWRTFTQAQFPWLRFIDIQHLWAEKTFLTMEMNRMDAYAGSLMAFSRSFKAAKGTIEHPDSDPITTGEDYKTLRREVMQWATIHSRNPYMTGLEAPAINEMQLERGWEYNMGLLIRWAEEKWRVVLVEEKHLEPINFDFFAHGVMASIQLFMYPNGNSLAKAAGVDDAHQMALFSEMQTMSQHLQKTVAKAAFSEVLFEKAFDDYLSYIDAIELIINKHKQSARSESDLNLLEAMTTVRIDEAPIYVGVVQTIKDGLNLHRLLVANFLSMAFGKSLHENKASIYDASTIEHLLKAVISEDLTVSNPSPLQQKIADIKHQMQDLKNKVIQHIKYQQNLCFFAHSLEHYPVSNTLKITPKLCSTPHLMFSSAHLDLIDQFLTQHPEVTKISLSGMALDDALVNAWVMMLRAYPRITTVSMIQGSLRAETLPQIIPLLSQIEILNLQDNALDTASLEYIMPLIRTSHLHSLSLAGNAFDSSFLPALAQNCPPTLKALDLSRNPMRWMHEVDRFTHLTPFIRQIRDSSIQCLNLSDSDCSDQVLNTLAASLLTQRTIHPRPLRILLDDASLAKPSVDECRKRCLSLNVTLEPVIQHFESDNIRVAPFLFEQRLFPDVHFGDPLIHHMGRLLQRILNQLRKKPVLETAEDEEFDFLPHCPLM